MATGAVIDVLDLEVEESPGQAAIYSERTGEFSLADKD